MHECPNIFRCIGINLWLFQLSRSADPDNVSLQEFRGEAKMLNMKDVMVRALEWEANKQSTTQDQESALKGSNVIELKTSNGTTVRACLVNDDARQ